MSWTLGQIVDRSEFEGIDEAQAIQIANQCYAAMVRRSGFLSSSVVFEASASPVPDGALTYTVPLPANVARVLWVFAQTSEGAVRWPSRIGWDQMIDAASQGGSSGYYFTETASVTRERVLSLWPAPPEGSTVGGLCELTPDPLINLPDMLVIPDEFVQGLLDGIKAIVFKDIDEDVGASQAMEASFQQAIADLADYTRARTVGDGPIAIPQRGVSW